MYSNSHRRTAGLSSGNVLQPVNLSHPEEEWKDLLNKLEKEQLIHFLPDKEPNEPTRRSTSTSKTSGTHVTGRD